MITTNLIFADWKEVFANAASVVALIDRRVRRAEIITIDGDSYRLQEAQERAVQKAKTRKAPALSRLPMSHTCRNADVCARLAPSPPELRGFTPPVIRPACDRERLTQRGVTGATSRLRTRFGQIAAASGACAAHFGMRGIRDDGTLGTLLPHSGAAGPMRRVRRGPCGRSSPRA